MDAELRTAISEMVPVPTTLSIQTWALHSPRSGYLVYLGSRESSFELTKDEDELSVFQVPPSGQLKDPQHRLVKERTLTAIPDTKLPQALWLRPKK